MMLDILTGIAVLVLWWRTMNRGLTYLEKISVRQR